MTNAKEKAMKVYLDEVTKNPSHDFGAKNAVAINKALDIALEEQAKEIIKELSNLNITNSININCSYKEVRYQEIMLVKKIKKKFLQRGEDE